MVPAPLIPDYGNEINRYKSTNQDNDLGISESKSETWKIFEIPDKPKQSIKSSFEIMIWLIKEVLVYKERKLKSPKNRDLDTSSISKNQELGWPRQRDPEAISNKIGRMLESPQILDSKTSSAIFSVFQTLLGRKSRFVIWRLVLSKLALLVCYVFHRFSLLSAIVFHLGIILA